MGFTKDLGTSTVHDICPVTGYPRDQWEHLLRPCSLRDGLPEENWDKPGTELYNLTNPYGHLYFACGSGDDFVCWGYETIHTVTGLWIVLAGTLNSETGGFIQGHGYWLMPVRSMKECRQALLQAEEMVEDAQDWCAWNGVRHSIQGWNQRPEFFRNCVARALFPWSFKKKWTDRMFRQNTKLVDRAVRNILNE